jgi:uncharacterized protein (TIGR04255 family)
VNSGEVSRRKTSLFLVSNAPCDDNERRIHSESLIEQIPQWSGWVSYMAKSRLDFGNLPHIETVVRATLKSSVNLTYSLVNSVAEKLSGSFPVLSEPKQFEMPPGDEPRPEQFGLGAALPGAVYTGDPTGLSVSLHAQVIVCRWTKYSGPGASPRAYPHFESVRDGLWNTIDAVKEITGQDFPGLLVVNMSYVNFIEVDADAIQSYLSDDFRLSSMKDAKDVSKLEASWRHDSDADIRFAIERATAIFPSGPVNGYRLTTVAGSYLDDKADAHSRLDDLHSLLGKFFLSLISKRAKQEWQLKGD